MKEFKTLTLKRILKKHQDNQQDSEAHKTIETQTIQKNTFDMIVKVTKNQMMINSTGLIYLQSSNQKNLLLLKFKILKNLITCTGYFTERQKQ